MDLREFLIEAKKQTYANENIKNNYLLEEAHLTMNILLME